MVEVLKGARALGFGILFLLWILVPSGMAVVDRIVAIVNQEIITLSEVERVVAHLKQEAEGGDRLERRQRTHELARLALERLIEERLIDQEARRIGIKVSPKEIEQAIEEIKRKNNATQEDLENALARDGWTLEGFRKEVEKRLVRTKLVHWSVKVDPNVAEKELREFYLKHIDRYRREASYRPAHILFKIPSGATPSEIREIRAKCEKVLAKIKAGEDFGEMALLYSEDLSSKDRGDLGVFKKGELLPALEREALRLKVGEVSGIVRTEYGFHILKLLDRKEADPLPFEEVKERVKQDYLEKEFEKGLQQFLTRLKEKATIDIKL